MFLGYIRSTTTVLQHWPRPHLFPQIIHTQPKDSWVFDYLQKQHAVGNYLVGRSSRVRGKKAASLGKAGWQAGQKLKTVLVNGKKTLENRRK